MIKITSDMAPNDQCVGAVLVPIASDKFVQGSTVAATSDNAPCEGITTKAPGVWYHVMGDGSRLVVSTCWGTEFDTTIKVFRGTCGSLSCMTANDDFCGKQSRVTFDSEDGESYYILVHGYLEQSGPFLLNVAKEGTLFNGFCLDARTLELGSYADGNNVYAHFEFGDSDVFCDEEIQITGPTVWYQVRPWFFSFALTENSPPHNRYPLSNHQHFHLIFVGCG
jgi:hypothetical protein